MNSYQLPTTIFVKGLGKGTTELQLHTVFLQFGDILLTQIAKHRSGRSAGFGIITYASHDAASVAIARMNNNYLFGRKICVKWFVPESETAQMNSATPSDFAHVPDSYVQQHAKIQNHGVNHSVINNDSSDALVANLIQLLLSSSVNQQDNSAINPDVEHKFGTSDVYAANCIPDAWAHIALGRTQKSTSDGSIDSMRSSESEEFKPWNLGINSPLFACNAHTMQPNSCFTNSMLLNYALNSVQEDLPASFAYLSDNIAFQGYNTMGYNPTVSFKGSIVQPQMVNAPNYAAKGASPQLQRAPQSCALANTRIENFQAPVLSNTQQLPHVQQRYVSALPQWNDTPSQRLSEIAAMSSMRPDSSLSYKPASYIQSTQAPLDMRTIIQYIGLLAQ